MAVSSGEVAGIEVDVTTTGLSANESAIMSIPRYCKDQSMVKLVDADIARPERGCVN